jgi:lipopolysaccharide/colanic/teichoic acid biosynthesis glycosyltransferase
MPLIAAVVKLDSGGPVFYRQERIGLNGHPFVIWKFRTMRCDAEGDGRARWADRDDARVTPVGRFLRSTRLDEIPQIVNVLRGEMSLVGPRPEQPQLAAELAQQIAFYNERHNLKPGITGWAQINFSYSASVADAREKLKYDMYYLKNWNLFLDLLILLETARIVLFREGAR